MKISLLKLQKIAFILNAIFVIGFFVSTMIYATSFYDTYLYGNEELINFYTNDLQYYNKAIFDYSLVLIILFVVCILIKPSKYYPSFITYPLLVIIQIVGIVLGIISVVQMTPILDFYEGYDYSVITKLVDYKLNYFFPIFTKLCGIGLAVINVGSLGVYSAGLFKYIKGRGVLNDKKIWWSRLWYYEF